MTVGFDGSRAFIKDRTGTENYSYQLLLNLSKIDRENEYLIYLRPGSIVNSADWPANFKFKEISFRRLWTQVGLSMRTFIDPIDVLFVPAHTLPLVRNPFLKTVMTVHDLGAEYLPKMHQIKQRLYLGFMTRVQLKSATKLIAVSQATRDDLVKKIGVNPKKIAVVYEAVDKNLFKPVKSDLLVTSLNKFNLEKGKYFLFVGTIQPRKNLTRLIEAFALFRDKYQVSSIKENQKISPLIPNTYPISLVLVGGKGWLSDEIYELPKKLGIEDQVRFLGRVEDADLPSLFSGAIALTYPSLFEGFGLPILEAWACDCPVLTSNHAPMDEVAGDAAILIDAYDTLSISQGLKKVTDQKTREALIKKGRIRLEKFSWEKAARETLEVLGSVIN